MKLRGKYLLSNFLIRHSEARSSLHRWVSIVELCEWRTHADLKRVFPSADYVGKRRYVFNIRGNEYRLVATIDYELGLLTVRFIGTHVEYDRIDCRTI